MKQTHTLFLKVYIPDRLRDTKTYAAMNVGPIPVWQEFKQGETLLRCNSVKEQDNELHIYRCQCFYGYYIIVIKAYC